MSTPKNHGATTPPTAVPIEKKIAIARARTSSGKISLTVRYAELAAEDAKKNITVHNTVCEVAVKAPRSKRYPVTIRISADAVNVPAIIGRRPTVSKKDPRTIGPIKFDSANGTR